MNNEICFICINYLITLFLMLMFMSIIKYVPYEEKNMRFSVEFIFVK